MSGALRALADHMLGLLFPDRCVGCGNEGTLLCAACQATFRPHPATSNRTHEHLADMRALFIFEGTLRTAIHTLKYRRIQRMAQPLGDLLASHLHRPDASSTSAPDTPPTQIAIDALVAVPLHPRRLAERGFNQCDLLARRIAQRSTLPVVAGLQRQRDTAHQVGLDASARQQNVADAFVWKAATPPPPRVLLIDDVLTTGATLQACARALHAAGCREVRALTLARSQPGHDQ